MQAWVQGWRPSTSPCSPIDTNALDILIQQGADVNSTFSASWAVCPILPPGSSQRHGISNIPASPTGSCSSRSSMSRLSMSRPKRTSHDSRTVSIRGVSGLHLAHTSSRCAERLIRHGAALHSRDDRGRTPLHWAVGAGSVEVVKLLIGAGADGDVTDDDGSTPLGMAMGMCGSEGIEMGRLILEARNGNGTEIRTGLVGHHTWV